MIVDAKKCWQDIIISGDNCFVGSFFWWGIDWDVVETIRTVSGAS